MADLKAFFAQNRVKQENVKFVVSKRFLDEQGKPMEWELRALDTEESEAIKRECTRRVKVGGNRYTVEVDEDKLGGKMAAACVVYPDLNDAALQDSYKVMGADQLLKKMLSMGEYAVLAKKITEINDLNTSLEELVDEAKN